MQSVREQPELVSSPPARRLKTSAAFAKEQPLKSEFSEPSSIKKPKFPKDLLDREGFVDPKVEASILAPQQSVASAQIVLEAEALSREMNGKKQQRESSFFVSLKSYLASFLAWVQKRFRGSRRARAKLTKQGEAALEQLKYLSALCDATSHRSPEEVLAAESAFGEAYYEIMSLSANLEKMAEKEAPHHLHRYSKHMASVLSAVD
ncbi:MAG: hypothetical protein QW568_02255 [Candidatus Anstonellaceae archaeon]